jgi:hypothetical protein
VIHESLDQLRAADDHEAHRKGDGQSQGVAFFAWIKLDGSPQRRCLFRGLALDVTQRASQLGHGGEVDGRGR